MDSMIPTTTAALPVQSTSDPTAVLITVAQAIVNAVTNADMEVDIGAVVRSITVRCNGTGDFEVEIDTEAVVDQPQLDAAIEQMLKGYGYDEND